MKKTKTILLQACLLLIIISTAFCFAGCRAEPEDTLPVEWEHKLGEDPEFVYEGVHYRYHSSTQWDVDWGEVKYIGHLFLGGVTGSGPPMKVLGIPFISGYNEAKGYFVDGRETPVLIVNDTLHFWLDTDITLESPEDSSFSSYIIWDRRKDYYESGELKYREDKAFTFEDILDRNKILKPLDVGENDRFFSVDFDLKHNIGITVKLPLDFPECIYCYVDVYEIDGIYYVPDTFINNGMARDTIVALSGKWQNIIAETVNRGGDENPQ